MDNYEEEYVMDVVEMMEQPLGVQLLDGALESIGETRESMLYFYNVDVESSW